MPVAHLHPAVAPLLRGLFRRGGRVRPPALGAQAHGARLVPAVPASDAVDDGQALGACERGEDVGASGVGGALRDIQLLRVDGPSWARSSSSLLARDSAARRAWLVRMSSSVRPRKSMACCAGLASSRRPALFRHRDNRRGAERLAVQFLRSITPSAGTPANQWCAPFYDRKDWLSSF